MGWRSCWRKRDALLPSPGPSVTSELERVNATRVLEYLAASRISITAAGLLARHLNEDNLHDLLGRCEGRTKGSRQNNFPF